MYKRIEDFSHYTFYLFGLIVLVIGIPWSPFLISLSQAILLANWILEGNIIGKLKNLYERKAALIFISIFLVHFIGAFYSTDINLAFKDIKIKLPLFIFPLVMATTKPISFKQLKIILSFFIVAIFISSFISILALFGFTKHEIIDIREISLFISHIRFSLLINIGLFSSGYLCLDSWSGKKVISILYAFVTIWFTIFLFILQSLTGIVVFIVIISFLAIRWSFLTKNKTAWYLSLSVIILISALIISLLIKAYQQFYNLPPILADKLEKETVNGNLYAHNLNSKEVENGNYVWLYVCDKELKSAWEKRSNIKYNSRDKQGHLLKLTLIRYLTSKGYRKDAQGVEKLTESEIDYIENGIANHIYLNRLSLYPRIYQVIWEIDQYKKGKNPSGHSVTQRFEYFKSAFHIIRNNFFFGVGTGDLKLAFDTYYENSHSRLTEKWRLRAHDQYVTFFLTFGIVGFLWIIFSLIYSIVKENGFRNYFFFFFFFIAFLSMINEDTLETQAGATFFAYFYSLFLFAYKNKKQLSKSNNQQDKSI